MLGVHIIEVGGKGTGTGPLGDLLGKIAELMGEDCDCDKCKCKKARSETRFKVVNGVVQFIVKDEHYDEIEELLRRKNTIKLFNDRATWIELFSGGTSAFHRLSDSGKRMLCGYGKLLLLQLEEREDPTPEVLHISQKLQEDNGECVNLIALLNRTDVEDEEMQFAISTLREFILETELDDEDIAEAEERITELKEIIPEELQNLTEPPELMVPADELRIAVKDHIAATHVVE